MSDIEHLKKDHSANGRIKTLILIVIIASLVWGMVGSIDLFIVSGLQGLFPTRTNFQYAILQIIIYLNEVNSIKNNIIHIKYSS